MNTPNPGDLSNLTPEQVHQLHLLLAKMGLQADPRDATTLGEIVEAYLPDAEKELSREAWLLARLRLKKLAKDLGHLKVTELTPLHLKEWIRAHPKWKSAHTLHGVNRRVQRCLNWAVAMKKIRENPFKGVSFPQGEPQEEMTDEEYRALLRASHARFRRILVFLRFTGCRPCEFSRLQWDYLNLKTGCFRLWNHKTRKKTGKPRTIVLAPVVMKLLGWMQRHGEEMDLGSQAGLRVFLTARGKPWARKNLIAHLQRAKKRAGISTPVRLYGLRHRFGTDGVRKGVNLKVLAELMGHSNVKMTEHYVHVAGDVQTMQEGLARMFS